MRTITLEEHCDGEHATTLGSKELSMTSTTASRSAGGRSSLLTAPALAGLACLVAWVAGLAVWPSNLDVAASGGQVMAAYSGHRGVAMLQSLLVHGVAAVALAVVVLALGQAARGRGGGPLVPVTVVAGIGAAVVSLVVSGIGYLLLSSSLAPTAFVSGPLLVVWVTATGISVAGRQGWR